MSTPEAPTTSPSAPKRSRQPSGDLTIERLRELRVITAEDRADVRELYESLCSSNLKLSSLELLTIRDLVQSCTQPSSAIVNDEEGDARGTATLRIHALLIAMFIGNNNGSPGIRVHRESLTRTFGSFVPEDRASTLANDLEAWWQSSELHCDVIHTHHPDDPPNLVGSQYRPIIRSDGYAYFHRFLVNRSVVRKHLRERSESAAADALPPDKVLSDYLHEILTLNPITVGGSMVKLNDEQKYAVGLSLHRRLLVLSGGPGTGKTSTVVTILRLLLRCGAAPDRIHLAAPTGRAARRMTESIHSGYAGLQEKTAKADALLPMLIGKTLHTLLDYNVGTDSFRYNAKNPLPADVVIIDEVSMVDVVLMAKLLEAVPSTARLILLGDKDQLPSVDVGTVLTDLLPAGAITKLSRGMKARLNLLLGTDQPAAKEHGLGQVTVPEDTIVVLMRNYRSEPHIQEVAAKVNSGEAAVANELPILKLAANPNHRKLRWPTDAASDNPAGHPPKGCWLLPAKDRIHWRSVLEAWAARHFLGDVVPSAATGNQSSQSYAALVNQCAAMEGDELLRSTALDDLINRLDGFRVLTLVREGIQGCQWVNEYLASWLRPRIDPRGRGSLFAGAPVMVVRNDRAKGVFNGDVGVCVRDVAGELHAVFRSHGGFVRYSPDLLPANEPAFAITVHKAQGSEYEQLLLVLPADPDHRLLTREILYTGITRAKSLCVIHSASACLEAGIGRKGEREGGSVWQ